MTRKGAHRPQKVINALVLLNCDEGAFNERRSTGAALAEVLRISLRRVDRVKKANFVARVGYRDGLFGDGRFSVSVIRNGGNLIGKVAIVRVGLQKVIRTSVVAGCEVGGHRHLKGLAEVRLSRHV